MARCGHAGQCQCVINGGPGTRVTGIGTPEQPYVVGVRLSGNAGNSLFFDGQGGLYGGGGGGTDGCGVSVGGLPEEHLVIGRGGAGRLLAPDHTLRSLTRAIDLSLPAVHVRCRPLSDGTPVAFPALSVRNQTGSFAQLNRWEELPNNHSDYFVPNMDLSAYKTMPVFAGWDRDYHVHRSRSTYNPGGGLPQVHYNQDNLGGRWGFFGFGEREQSGGLTLSEVLSHVGLRTVVMIEMAATTPQFLELVLEMIRRHCAQQSVIVSSQDLEDLTAFSEENIATMAWITSEDQASTNPPAEVVAAGVEWVNIGQSLSDATITGYTSAGLSVILSTLTRHWHWERVDALGARGALSDDPLYMMGYDDPDMHRVASGHTSLRHHGVYPGQLSWRTDEEVYWPPWARGEKLMGWGPGNVSTGPVPLLPPMTGGDATQWMNSSAPIANRMMSGYGLVIPRSGAEVVSFNGIFDILAGWLCPLEDPTSYCIEYQVCFGTSPNQGGRNIGIFFGLADDRSYRDQQESGAVFWQLSFQWNSQMYLRRYEGSTITDSVNVDTGDEFAEGNWIRFRVIVDDVGVRGQRVTLTGNIINEITLPGEAHGPYFMLYKNELGTDGVTYPFTSIHRQILVQSPYPEEEPPAVLSPDGSFPWELPDGGDDDDTEAARVSMMDELEGADLSQGAAFPDGSGNL